MDPKKLTTGVVMAAVVVILLATLLIPTINDYQTSTTQTKSNYVNNSNLMTFVENPDDLDITISWTQGNTYMTNGTTQVGIGAYNSAIIVSDKGALSISRSGNDTSGKILSSTDTSQPAAFTSAVSTITVKIEDNDATITVTYSDDTPTFTKTWSDMTWVAYADSNGNYKQKQNTASMEAYINPNQHVFGVGWISTSGTGYWAYKDTTSNVGAMTWDKDKVSGYDDLYNFNVYTDYHLSTSVLKNTDDTAITPYYVWIPINVDCHTTADTQYVGLFNVLPIMIIAALVVSIAAIFLRSRD